MRKDGVSLNFAQTYAALETTGVLEQMQPNRYCVPSPSLLQLTIDARGMKKDYQAAIKDFQDHYKEECAKANIDYVPIDTSVNFDKALMEYLVQRSRRF